MRVQQVDPPLEEDVWTFHVPFPPLAHYAPLAWDESYGRCTVALCGAEILGIDAFEPYTLCEKCERIWDELG